MLRETENLEEQGDILQHLVDTQGLDFNTGMLLCAMHAGVWLTGEVTSCGLKLIHLTDVKRREL